MGDPAGGPQDIRTHRQSSTTGRRPMLSIGTW